MNINSAAVVCRVGAATEIEQVTHDRLMKQGGEEERWMERGVHGGVIKEATIPAISQIIHNRYG